MKKVILASLVSLMATAAMADHSLQYVLERNKNIAQEVNKAMKRKGVICDVEHSIQMAPATLDGQKVEARIGGDEYVGAWRQVALCFTSANRLAEANKMLTRGNDMGSVYGVPADAILSVTYKFKSDRSEKATLYTLELK